MITVDIDGAKVPITKIRRYELNNGIDVWGGYKKTLIVEYITEKAEHTVFLTTQHALDVFNALKEAHKKQEQLTSLEVELDSIERVLKDLEEEYRNKKVEKYNLRNAIYALTKV